MTESLRVVQALPALKDGGVERGAMEMARYMSSNGVPNWVICKGGPLVPDVTAFGTHHIDIPIGSKNPFTMIRNARALAKLIDENRIDVVHALSRAPAWASLLACRVFAKRKCHFITTVHGAHGHQNRFKRFYNTSMTRSEIIIASSKFIQRHLISTYSIPENRIVVVQRGIDRTVFDPDRFTVEDKADIRSSLGVSGDTPLITMVGRITTLKGHAVLIEALSMIADRPWHAVFVGSGQQEAVDKLKELAKRLGVDKKITWTGARKDIPAILAITDLAISASIRPEAFGLGSVEAQAMRVPVIATNHGGSCETVIEGETGWLVSPGRSDSMAEAIDKALANPAMRAEMGTKGRENVLKNFTADNMLRKEFSVYLRALGETPIS